jgi:dynein heavy chain
MPGLTKLTWSKRHIKEYFVKNCREHCKELLSLVRAFHSTHAHIVACCNRIWQTLLVVIEKNTVYTDAVFAAKQERHRENVQQNLIQAHSDIVSSMNSSYIFREAPADVQREWTHYIRKMDRLVESSLRQTVKRSLVEISKAINGDSKNEPNPLFNVAMILDEAQMPASVAFQPTMTELTTLINEISRELITTIRVVPRLIDVLEYKRKRKTQVVSMNVPSEAEPTASGDEKHSSPTSVAAMNASAAASTEVSGKQADLQNFYDVIANDDDVLKTFVTIIQGMRDVSTDIHELVTYWKDAYKATWELDKDAYMRRYASTKRPLSSYDLDITRYRGLQEDIQSEDRARTVRFISVNCVQLKTSLVAHCLEWQKRLMTLLHSNASTELQSLHDLFVSTSEALMKEPANLDELGAGLDLLAKMKKDSPSIEARFEPLNDMFRTLNKFDVPLPEEEKEQLEALRDEWEQFGIVLRDAENILAVAKQAMKRGLELSLDSLSESLIHTRKEFLRCDAFKAPMPEQGELDIEGAFTIIDFYRSKVLEHRNQAKACEAVFRSFLCKHQCIKTPMISSTILVCLTRYGALHEIG